MKYNKNPNMNLLIVEDESIVMMITRKILEELGYQPDCAINGYQALELTKKSHYHVIFMDIGLPDIDGIATTEKIREFERKHRNCSSRIFALTAYSLAEVKDKCFIAGMNDVLSKPISPEILLNLFSGI